MPTSDAVTALKFSEISYGADDGIATITLNRPQARNGYTIKMADELSAALSQADADASVRVVVLTGAGSDFCVGADLTGGTFDFNEAGSDAADWQEPAGRCSRRIFTMTKPVIAALRGAAVGAGITITLACDFRIAATDSKIGFPFSRRGIFPEGGSAWYLPRLVGMSRASDWLITGRIFGAVEALESGLVSAVYEPDEVLGRAQELARDICEQTAPVSAAVIRRMLNTVSSAPSPIDLHRLDSRLTSLLPSHADAVEGVVAFLEKRSPDFPCTVESHLPPWLPWLQAGAE